MFNFGKICALFLLIFFSVSCIEIREAEKPYIDDITSEYLIVEQSLWSRIYRNSDKTALYSLVRSEHRRLFSNDFGVTSRTHDIYIPSGILVDNLKLVNDLFYNTSVLLNAESFDSVDIDEVQSILSNANLYSENVFREAIRAEFWEKGKNVCFTFLNFYSKGMHSIDFNIQTSSSTYSIAVNWKRRR